MKHQNITTGFLTAIFLFAMLLPLHARRNLGRDLWWNFDSRIMVESSNRSWNEPVYSPATSTISYELKEDDKIFVGQEANLDLSLKSDFSDTTFIDFTESLYFRGLNNRAPQSFNRNYYRYDELEHFLNIGIGVAASAKDFVKLDYSNMVNRRKEFGLSDYVSNGISGRFVHRIGEKHAMAFSGSYESRKYKNDRESDYERAYGRMEHITWLEPKYEYEEISSSLRGEEEVFERFPSALPAEKAKAYYTDYVRNPADDDPKAKYLLRKKRGKTFINAYIEGGTADMSNLDNSNNYVAGGFFASYDTDDKRTLSLSERYTVVDTDRESFANSLYDGYKNFFALSSEQISENNFAQSITYSNFLEKYSNSPSDSHMTNKLAYESFYRNDNSSFATAADFSRSKYEREDEYNADYNELLATADYNRYISNSVFLNFAASYGKRDYGSKETQILSNFSKYSFKIGAVKEMIPDNSLEVSYQHMKEEHDRYAENNRLDKTAAISWAASF